MRPKDSVLRFEADQTATNFSAIVYERGKCPGSGNLGGAVLASALVIFTVSSPP
jgi:hypothetical protein